MQGICIDTGSTTVLHEGQKYYLFEHGPNNYYVSKFDNANAHMGSYRREHFKLIQDDEQPQPMIKLQRFVAKVAKHRNGYNIGDLFIISEKGPNGYYHVYLKDRPAKGPVGSYITNFFEIIMPYDEVETTQAVKTPERPKLEAQPVEAAIPLPKAAEPEIEAEVKPQINITGVWIKKDKPKKEKAEKKPKGVIDGQLDIFDFLEG